MGRQYDAKHSVLKAYPTEMDAGVELFLEMLDVSEEDFQYEERMTPRQYIYGPGAIDWVMARKELED